MFDSWFGKRAHDYREFNKIPHDLGTAVNIVTMVFGNMGDDSGTGVAFTRDPNTGEKAIFGEYLTNAQGEDVVAGVRTPAKISQMRDELPEVYAQFEEIAERLESHYRDVQDLEFTIERGKLYMLQTRSGKRTAPAAVKIAVDMVSEGIITRRRRSSGSTPRRSSSSCCRGSTRRPRPRSADRLLGKGLNASPGAAVGQGDLRPGPGRGGQGGRRPGHPRPDRDLARTTCTACSAAKGVLTARGGATSHAAVVARGRWASRASPAPRRLKIDYAKREMRAGNGNRRARAT